MQRREHTTWGSYNYHLALDTIYEPSITCSLPHCLFSASLGLHVLQNPSSEDNMKTPKSRGIPFAKSMWCNPNVVVCWAINHGEGTEWNSGPLQLGQTKHHINPIHTHWRSAPNIARPPCRPKYACPAIRSKLLGIKVQLSPCAMYKFKHKSSEQPLVSMQEFL
jgi:hypothetical protein